MILLLLYFLSFGSIGKSDSENTAESRTEKNIRSALHQISDEAIYFGAGTAVGTISLLGQLGRGISHILPGTSPWGDEFHLLSQLCGTSAKHFFAQMFKKTSDLADLPSNVPLSHKSWYFNQLVLSQIPVFTKENNRLLQFLERRWLAKSTGFFNSVVNWVCPSFGIALQVHPDTCNSYARSPALQISQVYQKRVDAWKKSLPHPEHFPLLLTRPCGIQDYLPSCISASKFEENLSHIKDVNSTILVDLTGSDQINHISNLCQKHHIQPSRIICIERLLADSIGGIRILPLADTTELEIENQHRYLLQWISTFGISANRVELDRCLLSDEIPIRESEPLHIPTLSKNEFSAALDSFQPNGTHLQKKFMINGALQALKGLLAALPDQKWQEISSCPTRSTIAQATFFKIQEQLSELSHERSEAIFFDTISHIEQIHANLSTLLEIFSPFTFDDFPLIFGDILGCIPTNLKPLTSYGLHASAMTSLAGIFKAVEKTIGGRPRCLYGKNTYFECIRAANFASIATPIEEATEQDWKDVDLIVAQFNPVWTRTDFKSALYQAENIAENIHLALNARQGRPLTLALDSTLDMNDSPRVAKLLEEFQKEIEMGMLNVVCYRSGLKFDLFGIDNYSGAPLYMIHSQDPKWAHFDALPNDPVLQTDLLSLNWFCLAYKSAPQELYLYQKQIMDNTRALLNKMSPNLFAHTNSRYRVTPVDQSADPSFIDIKISGPFHQLRAAALVAGSLYVKCLEGGHPAFYRTSLGFYHPNFTMLFGDDYTSIRLTVGLDPAQIDLFAGCFETISKFNGP